MPTERENSDIAAFLKSFEGAAATFSQHEMEWSLWLPEISTGDRPLTPASQLYFPVLLRHGGQQIIAIRCYYDCSTGKVRYYTGTIPGEMMGSVVFENAVSELFRHSLPVEPVRQRKLRGGSAPAETETAAPKPGSSENTNALTVVPTPSRTSVVAQSPTPAPPVLAPEPAPQVRTVHVEIGHRIRDVMLIVAIVCGLVAVVAIAAYTYLAATEDPGVRHHRLQIEQMKLNQAP